MSGEGRKRTNEKRHDHWGLPPSRGIPTKGVIAGGGQGAIARKRDIENREHSKKGRTRQGRWVL